MNSFPDSFSPEKALFQIQLCNLRKLVFEDIQNNWEHKGIAINVTSYNEAIPLIIMEELQNRGWKCNIIRKTKTNIIKNFTNVFNDVLLDREIRELVINWD